MKVNFSFVIILCLFLCLSASCKRRLHTQSADSLIQINVPEPDNSYQIEDIYELVETIHLETEPLQLSGVLDIKKFENKLYVLDRSRVTLAVFDETGKYISHIKTHGRGPDEYLSIFSMKIDSISKKVLLTDNFQSKIFVYDLSLNHEKTIPVNFHPGEVAGFRNDLFLHGQTADIDRVGVGGILNNEAIIINTAGEVERGFIPIDYDISTTIPYRSISVSEDGGFLFHPTLSNIIYYVSDSLDSAVARYVIDFKLKKWKLLDREEFTRIMNKNPELATISILEKLEKEQVTFSWGYILNTNTHIVIRFGNFDPLFCVYDKLTGHSIAYFGEKIKGDNALRFITAFPFSTYNDVIYTGMDITTLKALSKMENFSQDWIEKIEKLDDFSNPIIYGYRIKPQI